MGEIDGQGDQTRPKVSRDVACVRRNEQRRDGFGICKLRRKSAVR